MSANDKTGVGDGSGEWGTPPEVFSLLNRRAAFNFDMWASHQNALLPIYATADGVFRKGEWAPEQLSTDDGMLASLAGLRCFGNPPYTRGLIDQCIQSLLVRKDQFDFMMQLVPAAPDTEWFQSMYDEFGEPNWLPKRLKFIHPPTRCRNRRGEECKHELNKPCAGSPGGMAVFQANIPRSLWLSVLK